MGNVQRTIDGVTVELAELAEGLFHVLHEQVAVAQVTFSRDAGHGRWFCPCGHDSGKRDPFLGHIVRAHVRVAGKSFEAVTTYLRLVGQHPDPTYDQAIHRMYGNPW